MLCLSMPAMTSKREKIKTCFCKNHADRIVATYEARKDVEGYAALVSCDALQNNGFNLSMARYVRRHRQEEVIDIEQVRLEIGQLEKAYADSRQKIDKLLKEAMS